MTSALTSALTSDAPAVVAPMPALAVSAFTVACAAGVGVGALWQSLLQCQTGLRRNDLAHCSLDTFIGRTPGVESVQLPRELAHWHCRNNQLAWLGLNQDDFLTKARACVQRYGATRVALVLGTSTSSIASTEDAYRLRTDAEGFPAEYREQRIHTPNSLTGFVAEALGIQGPRFTVATACSSSARVFGSAERLIRSGVVDAAIVGGVDSLCLSVMYGFNALELVSSQPCRPFDQARNGLNIGEASGFAILETDAHASTANTLRLVGYGESSDAFHMSSPHPEGLGAQLAMQAAMQRASLQPSDIDYVNLHGTATRMNDEVEGRAMRATFNAPVACSSTKAYTGHTLGAAGIVEAVITLLALQQGVMPGGLHCDQPEAALQDYLLTNNVVRPLRYAMSNSFGFGGNNCALIFAQLRDRREA